MTIGKRFMGKGGVNLSQDDHSKCFWRNAENVPAMFRSANATLEADLGSEPLEHRPPLPLY